MIDVEASLDAKGTLTSWHFININSGGAAVDTPYRTGKSRCRFVPSDSPLRQGSYRALAATANNFARECFMDELAAAAGADPLEFRLAHLEQPAAPRRAGGGRPAVRLARAGEASGGRTSAWGWPAARRRARTWPPASRSPIDRAQGRIVVRRVCEVFECGAILNPDNLPPQVQGCIIMGLGPALREEMRFENGKMLNAQLRALPRAAVQRRAGARHPPAEPARPAVGRRRRDADHRHRAGHRQRRLPRHRRARSARCRSARPRPRSM